MIGDDPLPRELAPGIFWLGGCLEQRFQGQTLHSYNSLYLVAGDDASLLVEAGHPQDSELVLAQLDELLQGGVAPLRYIFATHQETPHAGGVGALLRRYPDAELCGDVRDYHLFLPGLAERLRPLAPGERLDLGATEFVALDATIRDLASTRWGFDTRRRVLFCGDGFAYSHYHQAGHCGMVAEEVPELPVAEMTALFTELALYWTRFADIEPYIRRLDRVLDERAVRLVCPTHGLPITELGITMPAIRQGLRLGSEGGARAAAAHAAAHAGARDRASGSA
ncbi:MAG: MBL fold metallo-hydrolase [Solirubrobacteraceae bacterium]|nr:MBL fold metallo-hydrolase [Solirubrobacteraceae bacterium]